MQRKKTPVLNLIHSLPHFITPSPHHPLTPLTRSPALPFLLSRLWIAAFVYWGHAQRPYLAPVAGGWEGVRHWWLNAWTLFDSELFLQIAAHGYDATLTGTFPLYPLVLRAFGSDPVAMALGGVLVSNAAFFAGLCVFYRLTILDFDAKTARLAVWLLAFFPTGAVFSAVYSESLFFLLATSAFYAARTRRWAWCGVLAFLAALTRNSGALLFLALVWEWQSQRRANAASTPRVALLAAILPLAGFLGTQIGFATTFEKLDAGLTGDLYERAFQLPWLPIWNEIRFAAADLARGQIPHLLLLLNFAATLGAFILLWRYRKIVRGSSTIFVFGIIALHLIYGRVSPSYTNGALRFLMSTFPFAQLLALACQSLAANRFRCLVSTLIYLLLCAACSYLFGQKQFVPG